MQKQSSFSFSAQELRDRLSGLTPPGWLVTGLQNRLTWFVNHVLEQEPAARERLASQAGRVLRLQWRQLTMQWVATSDGFWALAPTAEHDLLLTLLEPSALALLSQAMQAQPAPIRIEGDADFAVELNWLIEHVRWDVEEDLSRCIGQLPAQTLTHAGRQLAEGLREFARRWTCSGKGA